MSPIHSEFQRQQQTQNQYTIDQALLSPAQTQTDTPTTAITETPYTVPSAAKGWQAEDPHTWTAQQVTIWMQDSGMESVIIDKFAFHDITGAVLLDLDFQDLKELGIESFGKRHQVWNHICTLRNGNGRVSPTHTPFEENVRRSYVDGGKKGNDQCEDTPITAGPNPRRRRKYRQNGMDPITPAESVSIVAIEQLIPKPHKCAKGENCHKWRKQQRLLRKLHEEHGLPISPENGGRIFMAGNPGNASNAPNVVRNVVQGERPDSGAEVSIVGPSVVASSDLLGPGDMPGFSLDADKLKQVDQRDPQDYVKNFLALQHLDPPQHMVPLFDDLATEEPQMRAPDYTPGPLSSLQLLPRLQIPVTALSSQQLQPSSAVPISATDDFFSPCRSATTSPVGPNLYRFGTPASEMDVPVTNVQLGPISRDNSQSVPPNMHFRDPVNRSASRPTDWRRQSFQLPSVAESEEHAHHAHSGSIASNSTRSTVMDSSSTSGRDMRAISSKTSNSNDDVYDARYPEVNHSGWMKKRKTRMLRHEWNEHHFRLSNKNATLTMHRNDLPSSSPLHSLKIDEYAVACSSIASNKLSAKLKALTISAAQPTIPASSSSSISSGKGPAAIAPIKADAFSFQLVPTGPSGDESGKLRKMAQGKKTHHFAVKSRDDRIDWMREIMLAKALREKEEEGYEVEHHRA
jgi:hypothetical protein